ncbi:serine hydrolase [Pedobacter sp. HMF7647]|uniref:Serine hydrolase n=1 Tax=Hufsiella arboris TaxID=2695275 RepID=A0A7K1YEP7_9SPHI|nr:serine hydrolase domain-containing protein [Hufsiella arboris]MXV53075.1 serine hydrolase [Hufsiella arboris]
MEMYKNLVLFLISFLSAAFSYGQDNRIEQQLDNLLSKEFQSTEPGCAILVAKDGQTIYKKAFGSADLELNVAMAPGMVFNLASVTKQFTAVSILQLVEQGKISLQDSLQKFVTDFPSKGRTITIENLLTHTSGIRDYMQIDYPNPFMERWDFKPRQLIDSFKNYPLTFEPGTKYSYSNSGYYLLGYIIEKVSGKSYQQYVRDNLLTPLGLSHSYFDGGGIIIPNRVKGYRKDEAVFKNADYWSPTIAYAAGGLLSNTEDLLKWFNGLLSYKILKKETLEKAFTPFTLKDGSVISYGYGWSIMTLGNIKSIEHAGNMSGFTTNEIYYPQQGVFIAALFNCENAAKDRISEKISEIVLGQPLQTQIKLNDEFLDLYAGTYTLTTDQKRTITVIKKSNSLFAQVSGQATFEILFKTPTTFQLKDISDMTGEFVSEAGRVTKIVVNQNGTFEWKKSR